MGNRTLFILLIFPFIIASVLVMIASAFYWLFTGRNLLYVIDWMVLEMKNLEDKI
jgi:predicted MFS family arabinose efflux permease